MTAAVELATRYTTPDTTVEIGTTIATVEYLVAVDLIPALNGVTFFVNGHHWFSFTILGSCSLLK